MHRARTPRLLLAQCYAERDIWDDLLGDLSGYRRYLLERFPQMEPWLPEAMFAREPVWPEHSGLKFLPGPGNLSGHFLASQLLTPSTVIDEPATPERVVEALERGLRAGRPYTHVGFSLYIDGYSDLEPCVQAAKRCDPHVVTLAGNVGALFAQTPSLVDHCCIGDGVPFLRRLLGEPLHTLPRLAPLLGENRIQLFGFELRTPFVQLVTRLGCPQTCDFCATRALFGKQQTGALFTPAQVHASLTELRALLGQTFRIGFCEAAGLIDPEWWYALSELFRDDPDDYPVIIAGAATVMQRLDLDRLRDSALRLELVNIGVESLSKPYAKTRGVALKQLVKKLRDAGIATYATYIVGFDHHDRRTAQQELQQLLELETALTYVDNLKAVPGTALWRRMQRAGRLLDVPNDFYYLTGFQAFDHPHFAPGFGDLLPLMIELHSEIERARGPQGLGLLDAWRHLPAPRASNLRELRAYEITARLQYPLWRERLRPSPAQNADFFARVGDPSNVPLPARWLASSSTLRQAVGLINRWRG